MNRNFFGGKNKMKVTFTLRIVCSEAVNYGISYEA